MKCKENNQKDYDMAIFLIILQKNQDLWWM